MTPCLDRGRCGAPPSEIIPADPGWRADGPACRTQVLRRQPGRRGRRGFTLIEIMVSLVIVSILVMLVGNIFDQASDSWYAGMGSTEMNNAGRAVMDLMATELSQAIAGRVEHAEVAGAVSNIVFIQNAVDDIAFVCLNQEPDSLHRGVRGLEYYMDGTDLKRVLHTLSFNAYKEPYSSWGAGQEDTLLPNVERFEVVLYNEDLSVFSGTETNALPACADLLLEVVPDSARVTLGRLAFGSDEWKSYRAANIRAFSTRVYFRNRLGYLPR